MERITIKPLILLLIALCFLVSCTNSSNEYLEKDVTSFIRWLESHQQEMGKCLPAKEKDHYRLCDGTVIDASLLGRLFSFSPEKLIDFIKQEGIELKIYCKPKGGTFANYCSKSLERSTFKDITSLHGQYKPSTNTIMLHSDANHGSLVHEYIHYLQYKNKNPYYGKAYKSERIKLQNRIVSEMDEIIEIVKMKKAPNHKLQQYLKRMLKLASLLKSFSKWQDLIDERNIFQLYIMYGQEFGVTEKDIKLARKNMGFICKREDIRPLLSSSQCLKRAKLPNEFQNAVKEIIAEVRPKPDLSLLNKFIENVPKISSGATLAEKVETIKNYIYKEWKMGADSSFRSRSNQDNILPDSALKFRKAHCVGLTTLFLIAGETLGMNGKLVRIPNHVFPRFCDQDRCLDIETLKNGKFVTEQYYYDQGMVTNEAVKGTQYFQGLETGNHLKSSIYLSLGYIAGMAKQLDLAELFYKKSIDNSRGFAESYSNLASIYAALGQHLNAKMYLSIALKINPRHPASLVNLGIYMLKEGKEDKALKFFSAAIKSSPIFIKAYLKRAELFEKRKEIKKMMLDLESALVVKPELCKVIEKTLRHIKKPSKKDRRLKDLNRLKESGKCVYLSY